MDSLSSETGRQLPTITSKLNLQKLANLIEKCNGYEPFYEDNASDLIQFSAYSGDTLVGFISCILPEYVDFSYESYAAYAYANTIQSRTEVTAMTHPDYRRRGVFTALFARLTKELEHKGYNTKNICFFFCMEKSLAQQLSGSSLQPAFAHSEYLMQYTKDFPYISNMISHHLSSGQKNTMEPALKNFSYTFYLDHNMYKILDSSHGIKNPAATLSLEFFKTHTCIHHVWVEQPLRQHGLATALVKYVLSDYFIRLGHTAPLILHVSGQNKPACALYQKCGFSVTEQSDYYTILPQ